MRIRAIQYHIKLDWKKRNKCNHNDHLKACSRARQPQQALNQSPSRLPFSGLQKQMKTLCKCLCFSLPFSTFLCPKHKLTEFSGILSARVHSKQCMLAVGNFKYNFQPQEMFSRQLQPWFCVHGSPSSASCMSCREYGDRNEQSTDQDQVGYIELNMTV